MAMSLKTCMPSPQRLRSVISATVGISDMFNTDFSKFNIYKSLSICCVFIWE